MTLARAAPGCRGARRPSATARYRGCARRRWRM